ncbi:MAG: GTPase [Planctomycetota bacterium]
MRAWVSTPAHARGAIACVELSGEGLVGACADVGIRLPGVGWMGLRDLAGIDEGVVVRWSDDRATLMCHGSPAIASALVERFGGADEAPSPRERFPEASSEVEACALDVMSRAASPRAVDVLLGQVGVWGRVETPAIDDGRARTLQRLIDPPVVVAVGRANVGKSTLLNALAACSVSVVSPEAGTTRDGVTALLELDGLAVRWVDTPGVREGAGDVETRAAEAAWAVVRGADLVVHCADAGSGWLDALPIAADRVLRCGTRGDLGGVVGAEVVTAAAGGVGVGDLAHAVRDRLVPDDAIAEAGRARWVFYPSLARAWGVG